MSKNSNWTPEILPPEQSQTRTAAAAWLYARQYDPQEDASLSAPLQEVLSKLKSAHSDGEIRAILHGFVPQADLDVAEAMVRRRAPYEDITDELIDEVMDTAHGDGFEILPWREAVLRVLTIDFLAQVKGASAVPTEDALVRITTYLDEKLRGASKNACQFITGQRTRIRKGVRLVVLAMLYVQQLRGDIPVEDIQHDVMQLACPCGIDSFLREALIEAAPKEEIDTTAEISPDPFPFDGFIRDGVLNARGRYVCCEASKVIRAMRKLGADIDTAIQNSSKKWRIERMSIVDLNILRLGAYELLFERASAPRVLINEAVELAKTYGAEQSKSFVNGILQQICNDNHIEVA